MKEPWFQESWTSTFTNFYVFRTKNIRPPSQKRTSSDGKTYVLRLEDIKQIAEMTEVTEFGTGLTSDFSITARINAKKPLNTLV